MSRPVKKYERIYAAVRQIPAGRVATYGEIARAAGLPGQARLVGYALHALAAPTRIPWHRVVGSRGVIALRDAGGFREQAYRLQREGVEVGPGGRIDLRRFGWKAGTVADEE